MLNNRINSFRYAFKGIITVFRTQPNAKIHLAAAVLVIFVGFALNINATEWCILTLCIAGVISAEAANTALENLTDLVSPDYHPLAGKAKDTAAAAVLIFAIGAAIVGGIIFLPKILALFT